MTSRTHYQILGLAEDADLEQVKAAYRLAAKRHHPDQGGDPARFQQATEAYETLVDPIRRSVYDATLAARSRSDQTYRAPGSAAASTNSTASTTSSDSTVRQDPLVTQLTHPRAVHTARLRRRHERRCARRAGAKRRLQVRDLLERESGRLMLSVAAVAVLFYALSATPRLPIFGTLGLVTVSGGWGYLPAFLIAAGLLSAGWVTLAMLSRSSGPQRSWVRPARLACSWLILPALAPALASTFLFAANFGLIAAAGWMVWTFLRS
jgi:hypothetical protein